MTGYTAQAWAGIGTLRQEITGCTRDTAHAVAREAMRTGLTGRVIPPDLCSADWTVYDPTRGVRTGRYEEITLVFGDA